MANKILAVLGVSVAALSLALVFSVGHLKDTKDTDTVKDTQAHVVDENYQQVTSDNTNGNLNTSVTVDDGSVDTKVTVQ